MKRIKWQQSCVPTKCSHFNFVAMHIKELRTSWILCELRYVSDIKTNISTCDYLSEDLLKVKIKISITISDIYLNTQVNEFIEV
jgi:hypothetical protein